MRRRSSQWQRLERLSRASAFPLAFGAGGEFRIGEHGLTKREFLAALALQGMIASAPIIDRTKAHKPRWAIAAVEFADELLKALAR